MKTSFLEVCFKDQAGNWNRSRVFQTLRAARNWAKLIAKQAYVADVAIYRGGVGGELVALTTQCPGELCPMCNGEACALCGAGCWSNVKDCAHDVMDRHLDKAMRTTDSNARTDQTQVEAK